MYFTVIMGIWLKKDGCPKSSKKSTLKIYSSQEDNTIDVLVKCSCGYQNNNIETIPDIEKEFSDSFHSSNEIKSPERDR